MTRREICETAAENNIKYLEWGGDVHLPPDDLSAREEVVALQKEFGLECVSYGSYYRLGTEDYELWRKTVDTARAVGAKTIRIWAGDKPSSKTGGELSEMIKETQRLSDTAGDLNVAFEFHKNTYNDCGKCCEEFLSAVSRENVKTYWQPMSIKEDKENLKSTLQKLVTVHVFHWNKIGKRYSLKKGRKVWTEFFGMIPPDNVNFIMEFVKHDSKRQFARDVKTLRSILDEVYR